MLLLPPELRQLLIANNLASRTNAEADPFPVVKLFTPDAHATWLISEVDADDPTLAFGLCDLGLGCPELGYVSLDELEALRGPLGLRVERDLHFVATRRLSEYATAARVAGRIIA